MGSCILALWFTLVSQQGKLPSDEKVKKAELRLSESPDDPDANLVMGKHLAFRKNDWEKARAYLLKGVDSNLRKLAEREDENPQDVKGWLLVGDCFLRAAKKIPEFKSQLCERSAYWYGKAWTEVEDQEKEKLRATLRSMFQNSAAPLNKGLVGAKDWESPVQEAKAGPTAAAAKSGRNSFHVTGMKHPQKNYVPLGKSLMGKPGASCIFRAWVLTDENDSADEAFIFPIYGADGKVIFHPILPVPNDRPWWRLVETKFVLPEDTLKVTLGFVAASTTGCVFIDDVSFTMDGREMLKNNSFEER